MSKTIRYNKFARRLAANGILFNLSSNPKAPSIKRAKAPGELGFKKRKLTPYAEQLIEVRKTQIFYDLKRHQLKTIFKASKSIDDFVSVLESRLINIVNRCFVDLFTAIQYISHKKISVTRDGKKMKRVEKGFLVKVGDIISIDEKLLTNSHFLKQSKSKNIPNFAERDKIQSVKIISKPSLNSSFFPNNAKINFALVGEFLSYR